MANNPKIEVYQIWLNPKKNDNKTFRFFYRDKCFKSFRK